MPFHAGRIIDHLLGAREQPLPGVRGLIRANQIRIYLSEMDLTFEIDQKRPIRAYNC